MFYLIMTNKGFTDNSSIETPNDINMTEKPLKSKVSRQNRVDINVLINYNFFLFRVITPSFSSSKTFLLTVSFGKSNFSQSSVILNFSI